MADDAMRASCNEANGPAPSVGAALLGPIMPPSTMGAVPRRTSVLAPARVVPSSQRGEQSGDEVELGRRDVRAG